MQAKVSLIVKPTWIFCKAMTNSRADPVYLFCYIEQNQFSVSFKWLLSCGFLFFNICCRPTNVLKAVLWSNVKRAGFSANLKFLELILCFALLFHTEIQFSLIHLSSWVKPFFPRSFVDCNLCSGKGIFFFFHDCYVIIFSQAVPIAEALTTSIVRLCSSSLFCKFIIASQIWLHDTLSIRIPEGPCLRFSCIFRKLQGS